MRAAKLKITHFSPFSNILFMAQQSQWVSSLSRFQDHTQTHRSRWDSSGRVIGPSQIPLPDNTQIIRTDIHDTSWIRTLNPSKTAAADPRLRPRGHWVGLHFLLFYLYSAQYFLVIRRQSMRLDYGLDDSSSIPGKDKKNSLSDIGPEAHAASYPTSKEDLSGDHVAGI